MNINSGQMSCLPTFALINCPVIAFHMLRHTHTPKKRPGELHVKFRVFSILRHYVAFLTRWKKGTLWDEGNLKQNATLFFSSSKSHICLWRISPVSPPPKPKKKKRAGPSGNPDLTKKKKRKIQSFVVCDGRGLSHMAMAAGKWFTRSRNGSL